MKGNNYILVFLLIALYSCYNEYIPTSQSTDQKLVAIAELEAGSIGHIHLGSTFGINMEEVELDHEISKIDIINFPESNGPEEYRYDKALKRYENPTFKPIEGGIYQLLIDANIDGISQISSFSRVPYMTNYLSEPVVSQATLVNVENKEISHFNVEFSIDQNQDDDNYFHLVPGIDENNSLIVDKITEGENALHSLVHRDGILIDKSKLSAGNTMSFSLKTTNTLEVSNSDPLFLYLELRTITKEYYDFHLAISRQGSTNAGPYTLPVSSFTNIENGYGLFATYSSVIDSTLIQ